MWPKFKSFKKDHRSSDHDKGLNLNDEYHRTLRTRSYVEFSTKAQTLANNHNSPSLIHHEPLLLLLEPDLASIRSILNSTTVLSKFPDLKPLFLNYFDSTADSSRFCTHLLTHIARITHPTHHVFDEMPIGTTSFVTKLMNNTFVSEPSNYSFLSMENLIESIGNRHSSVLDEMKSKRRKVKRKIKVIGYINKVAGISVAAACGVLALTAVVLAAHTFTALVMGPMAVVGGGFGPVKKLVTKVLSFKVRTSIGLLRRVHRQLDVAMKCVYILNRDMDTVSRLVTRLHDEVEHGKEMVKFWSEKMSKLGDHTELFKVQVVKEMKRKECELRKQVDELEELLCLCLLTINRARGLVAHELTK